MEKFTIETDKNTWEISSEEHFDKTYYYLALKGDKQVEISHIRSEEQAKNLIPKIEAAMEDSSD